MMIRFLSSIAGVNYSHSAGDEEDYKSDEAKRLINAGIAEEIKQKPATKKTTKKG